MTQPKRLSDRLSVTPQVAPADLQTLADAGFRSIIGNRPDGEDQDQPDWATIERAGRDAGMEGRHIPVSPNAITDDHAARFEAALDERISAAANAGYDIAPMRDRLAQG